MKFLNKHFLALNLKRTLVLAILILPNKRYDGLLVSAFDSEAMDQYQKVRGEIGTFPHPRKKSALSTDLKSHVT